MGISGREVDTKMAGYSRLKDYIYVIAAIIYVGAMFPLYFVYQSNPSQTFGILPNLSLISIGGAFLVFLQLFVAAWDAPNDVRREATVSSSS